jgi:Zn-finger nucleic acid-binding protein
MMRHFFSVRREVQVDECPKCGGVWLDYGELAAIRNQFESEEERKKAAEKAFSDIFESEFARKAADKEVRREKPSRLLGAFRFLYPGYYLPSKRDWKEP